MPGVVCAARRKEGSKKGRKEARRKNKREGKKEGKSRRKEEARREPNKEIRIRAQTGAKKLVGYRPSLLGHRYH